MAGNADAPPVVVTGGAGAIGAVLAEAVRARGAEVRIIDNLSSGRREHLLPRLGTDPGLSLTVGDLREPGEWSERFRGAGTVWHLAANPDIRRGTEDPRLDLENGTIATFRVLEAARRHDVPRIGFSSSSVVYGYPTVFPTPEEYGPLVPQSLYAASKLASEGLLSAYAHCYGMRVHIFRFANIVGPHMTHGILFDLFAKLDRDPTRLEVLGDGRQAKSYLRTEECVEGMLRLAESSSSDPVGIFNLGAADRISVREIAEKVVRARGGRARIEYTGGAQGWKGDVPQQWLSIEKARRHGWSPRWTSAEAVDRSIEELLRSRGAR
ncbi:MAG: NAD-dependent epimerase/dehydratase family protein [Thermoplasmata archaeon]